MAAHAAKAAIIGLKRRRRITFPNDSLLSYPMGILSRPEESAKDFGISGVRYGSGMAKDKIRRIK